MDKLMDTGFEVRLTGFCQYLRFLLCLSILGLEDDFSLASGLLRGLLSTMLGIGDAGSVLYLTTSEVRLFG